MASDLEIGFKVTGDSKDAIDAIDGLSESVDSLNEEAGLASITLTRLHSVADQFKEVGDSFKTVGGEIKSLGGTLSVVTAPLTVIAGLGFKNIYDLGNSITASNGPFKEFATTIKTLKDQFTELSIEVAQNILPHAQGLINFATNAVAAFRRLDDETKELVVTIGAIAVALGPTLILFGSMMETFGRLLTLAKPLLAALSTIGSVFAAKIAVIASVVAGVAGLVNVFLKLRDAGVGTVDALSMAWDLFAGAFVKYVVGTIVTGAAKIMEVFAKIASFGSEDLAAGLRADAAAVQAIADGLSEPFEKAKDKIDDKLEEIGSSAGDAFTFGLSGKIGELKDSFSGMFETPDLTGLSDQNAKELDAIASGYESLYVTVDNVNRQIESSMANTTTNGLMSMIDGTKSVAEAFQDMAQKIVQDLVRIMIQAQITNAIAGQLGAPSSGGGGIFSAFATGGYVSGPGSSMSDSIPARLSNGEYVVRASAVKKVGIGFLDYINNLGVGSFKNKVKGHFADGGQVQSGASGGGGVSVEIINNGTAKESADVSFDAERMVVSVVLDDLNRNGSVSKAISSTFGVRRSGFR